MEKTISKGVHYITIEPEFADQRIDNFLVARFKNIPKSHIYRLLRKGEVRVNKKRAKPAYRLQAGDQLRIPPIRLAEKAPVKAPSQSFMAILADRILYEDNHLLIINKPSGIPVHGGSQVKLGIIEALRSMYPKLPHLELAHRLDSDTSGCLILAKKRSILKELHELLRSNQVRKLYWALTRGHWDESELRVDAPLRKNYLSNGERIVKVDPEGKTALTLFKPLEHFADATLMEITLCTGRTHQIRVHTQYKSHFIAGDEKYGNREFNKQMRHLGLKRLFLHAHTVEFTLPSLDQRICVQAPLDQELVDCLKALK